MDSNNPPPAASPAPPDAPDKEKMDQIRRRRLEKLGGPPQVRKETSGDENSANVSSSSTPATHSRNASPKPKVEAPSTPVHIKAEAPLGRPQSSIKITPKKLESATLPEKRQREVSDGLSGPPARKPAPLSKEESLEAFESRALSQIFRLSVDPEARSASPGHHKLIYLADLKQELEDDKEPVRLSIGTLDSALMEACRRAPHNKYLLDYLLPCWKRITKMQRTVRTLGAEKENVIKEARRLCMSNCIFAVTMPELYGREDDAVKDSLASYLLNDPRDDKGICPDFLAEAVARWDEDDGVKPMFTKAFARLSGELSRMTMNDDYKKYVSALKTLTRFPVITTAIAEDPLFFVPYSAPAIELDTLLGPFFRISPLQKEVTSTYFTGAKTLDKGRIATAQTALRMSLATHQKDLLDIINQFVRASNASRERTLLWFAHIVNSNQKRRAMQVDEKTVSSDGFMINVTVTLDGLCEPFMDATFSKVSRIDADYFRKNPRVDIKDETKLNADEKTSNAFYQQKLEGTPNFITDVFFLTMAAHHYGSEALSSKMKALDKDIRYMISHLAKLELERPRFSVGLPSKRFMELWTQLTGQINPPSLARFEHEMMKYNTILEKSMALKMCIEGVLHDDVMQVRSLQFSRYVMVFMLRTASGTDWVPGKPFNLPLPAEETDVFKNFPEYMFEDVIKNAIFIFRYMPKVVISSTVDELIVFCITFLRNSEYIKNPALKQKLVTLLSSGIYPVYHRTKGILGEALTSDKFATDNLLHSLMKYYIEIEQGLYYTERYGVRYEIFQIFKCIWTNPIFKQNLEQESKVNTDFFIRYVNLLLNDTTYLLDECLGKLPKIHDLQLELSSERKGSLTDEEKKEKLEELEKLEGQTTSYMQLANETIAMMKVFTETLSEAFTMPEVVQRLADMLDYNLNTLVGEKSRDLKVQDMTKYHFNPRVLLAQITDIYINLGKRKRFIEAVAKDGRSYKPENFDNASRILTRYGLKSEDELHAWQQLAANVKKAKEIDDQAEEDLGEIPDEFSDPIMGSLMEDPVILPMSRLTVDRSTIRAHLLSSPLDPFNRQPLKIEDVIPDTELLQKIQAWKEERKAAAKKVIEDKMDDDMVKEEVKDEDKMDIDG